MLQVVKVSNTIVEVRYHLEDGEGGNTFTGGVTEEGGGKEEGKRVKVDGVGVLDVGEVEKVLEGTTTGGSDTNVTA